MTETRAQENSEQHNRQTETATHQPQPLASPAASPKGLEALSVTRKLELGTREGEFLD